MGVVIEIRSYMFINKAEVGTAYEVTAEAN